MKCKAVLCGVQARRSERILRSFPYQAIAQSGMTKLRASVTPVASTDGFPRSCTASFHCNRLSTTDPCCGKIEAVRYRRDEWCWLVRIRYTGQHRETGSQGAVKTSSQGGITVPKNPTARAPGPRASFKPTERTKTMKKGMKIALIAIVVSVVVIAAAGGFLRYMMGKPLYEPGMVRSENDLRAPLAPPEQLDDKHFWNVEDDIHLYHFTTGEGRSILMVHGGPGYPFSGPLSALESLSDRYRFYYYDQRGSSPSTGLLPAISTGTRSRSIRHWDSELRLLTWKGYAGL